MSRVLLSLLVVVPSLAWAGEPRSFYEFTVDLSEDNQLRIQKHLRSLVTSLGQKDVSHLTAQQRTNRHALIERLDGYWREGVFPQNHRYPGLRPVFIDDGQRACAVADLMIHSGAGELAERIASQQNYAYVPDINVEGLADWVAASGLTLDECAMIQPAYPCQVFSSTNCSAATDDVTLTWSVNYTPTSFIFGEVRRDGVAIMSWHTTDPGVYVDENLTPGVYNYEIYWEEGLVCYDTAVCTVQVGGTPADYARGDINGDGAVVPLAEAIYLLNWGHASGPAPGCMAAADINGDGSVSAIADSIYFLNYQFVNGPPPPEPFAVCGVVPGGVLDCLQPPMCP